MLSCQEFWVPEKTGQEVEGTPCQPSTTEASASGSAASGTLTAAPARFPRNTYVLRTIEVICGARETLSSVGTPGPPGVSWGLISLQLWGGPSLCNREQKQAYAPCVFLSSTKSEQIIYFLRMSKRKKPKWGPWENSVEQRNESIVQGMQRKAFPLETCSSRGNH